MADDDLPLASYDILCYIRLLVWVVALGTNYMLMLCSIRSRSLPMATSTTPLNINLGWIMEGNPPHLIMKVSKYLIYLFAVRFCISMLMLVKIFL